MAKAVRAGQKNRQATPARHEDLGVLTSLFEVGFLCSFLTSRKTLAAPRDVSRLVDSQKREGDNPPALPR